MFLNSFQMEVSNLTNKRLSILRLIYLLHWDFTSGERHLKEYIAERLIWWWLRYLSAMADHASKIKHCCIRICLLFYIVFCSLNWKMFYLFIYFNFLSCTSYLALEK